MTAKNEIEVMMETVRIINEFDSSQLVSNGQMIVNKVYNRSLFNTSSLTFYSSILKRSISEFTDVRMDESFIESFQAHYDNLTSTGFNLGQMDCKMEAIHTDKTEFKPKYLSQYMKFIAQAINASIHVKGSDYYKYAAYLSQSPDTQYSFPLSDNKIRNIAIKIEKQVVRNANDYGMNYSQKSNQLYTQKYPFYKVTNDYTESVLIPYMYKYVNTKGYLIQESEAVYDTIVDCIDTFNAISIAQDKLLKTLDLNKQDDRTAFVRISQLSYTFLRTVIQVISYTTYKMIHKLNSFSKPAIDCGELLNKINEVENTVIQKESAFDYMTLPTDTNSLTEDMISGDAGAFKVIADNIYNYNINLPSTQNIDALNQLSSNSYELDQDDYDKKIYDIIIKVYLEISAGLDIISEEGGDYLMIFDDVMKASGFQKELVDRFQNEIRAIEDVSTYKSNVDLTDSTNSIDMMTYSRMLSEVKNFGDNMDRIADTVSIVYKKLIYLANRYADNVNGEYTDIETINELKTFLKQLKDQFTQLTNKVCVGFFNRIKALAKMLNVIEVNASNDPDEAAIDITSLAETDSRTTIDECVEFEDCQPDFKPAGYDVDFMDNVYASKIERMEEAHADMMERIQEKIFLEKTRKETGFDIIFEADDDQKQGHDGPSVVDTSGNSKTSDQDGKGFIDKLKTWLDSLTSKFFDFLKGSGAFNSKFINDNKNALLSRDYSGVTIKNLAPYIDIVEANKKLCDGIKTFVTSISTENGFKSALGTATEKDFYAKMFPSLGALNVEGNDKLNEVLKEKITQALNFGTNGTNTPKDIGPNDAQQQVQQMVDYCENYYSSDSNNLTATVTNRITELSDDTLTKFDKASSGFTTTNQSNNNNGNQNNNNNNDNNAITPDKAKGLISSGIQTLCGCLLNCMKFRGNDYMKVLRALVPVNNNNNNQNNNTNTANNTNNDQNSENENTNKS